MASGNMRRGDLRKVWLHRGVIYCKTRWNNYTYRVLVDGVTRDGVR